MSAMPPAQQPPAQQPEGGPSVSVFEDLNPSQMVADNIVTAIGKAAVATPRAGSVTQSSNVDNQGVTTDQVDVTAEYGTSGPGFAIRNGTTWSIGMGEGNSRRIPGTTPPWQGAELSKNVTGGTVYVDVYTDIEAPEPGTGTSQPVTVMTGDNVEYTGSSVVLGQGQSTPGELNGQQGTFTCAQTGCSVAFTGGLPNQGSPLPVHTVSGITFVPSSGSGTATDDTDYLAGGVWLFVPDGATSADDYVFGAFGDGSDPFAQSNIMALTGTATYEGAATGVYSEKTAEATSIGYFDGDVELTANFGGGSDLGTISGSITNFEVDGDPEVGTLNLGTADIGSLNSGFFQGDVTGSDDERMYTGNWGGQFFGNGESDGKPGSVGGTFGGSSTDDEVNFVGVFGAHKQ